jgi:ethanolamine utilization protein EutQ
MDLITTDLPLTWHQPGEKRIFLADALDHTSDAAMSVGFARYAAGESNEWTMSYDEALVITRGVFTVRSATDSVTARAGQVIFLRDGEEIVYQADEDAELVYVTHPHWLRATEQGPQAGRLAEWHPVQSAEPPVASST